MITRIIFVLLPIHLFFFLGCSYTYMTVRTIKGVDTIDWATLNNTGLLVLMGSVKSPHGKETIVMYDVSADKLHSIFESDQYMLRAAFHPIKLDLVACCDRTCAVLVDWKTNKIHFKISLENGFVSGMAFSTDGRFLFIVHSYFSKETPYGWDRTNNGPYCVSEIIKVDIEDRTIKKTIFLGNEIATGTDFYMSHDLAGIRYMGGKAEVWDLKNEKCVLSVANIRNAKCIAFIDDSRILIDGVTNNSNDTSEFVLIFDIKTMASNSSYHIHRMNLCGAGIIYDRDGNLLILSGSQDQQARLWNPKNGKTIWVKRFRNDVGVGTSKNGRRAVVYSSGKTLFLEF